MNPSCKLFVSQVGAIASSEGAEASLLLPCAPGTSKHTDPVVVIIIIRIIRISTTITVMMMMRMYRYASRH